jgi:hypothetical protein
MNKLNYAIAMLTAAGGSAALSMPTQASVLYGDFSDGSYNEHFEIQTVGTPEGNTHFADFVLSNDSMGNTVATAGDETTGFKSNFSNTGDSYFGTGPAGSSARNNQTSSSFKPVLYSSTAATPVLQAGTYRADFGGGLTLTLSAVPEPEAWALLIAGAAMTGGALRASRRRSRVAAA